MSDTGRFDLGPIKLPYTKRLALPAFTATVVFFVAYQAYKYTVRDEVTAWMEGRNQGPDLQTVEAAFHSGDPNRALVGEYVDDMGNEVRLYVFKPTDECFQTRADRPNLQPQQVFLVDPNKIPQAPELPPLDLRSAALMGLTGEKLVQHGGGCARRGRCEDPGWHLNNRGYPDHEHVGRALGNGWYEVIWEWWHGQRSQSPVCVLQVARHAGSGQVGQSNWVCCGH